MKIVNNTNKITPMIRWLAMRVVAVGGNSNNGGNAGVFYVNANNGSGNRNTNIGRQLSLFLFRLTPITMPLGKIQSKPKVLVAICEGSGR
jgi:hypothetical protein